jgi:RNA polymerase sigma-70 factor (ECF subfamily)
MKEDELIPMIRECLNGNKEAFTKIVRHFQKQVFILCLQFLNSPQDAEDATMDIFLKIYSSLNSYNPDYKFTNWVFKIAINHLIDILRKRKREKIFFSEFLEKMKHNELVTPEFIFFKKLEINRIRNAMKQIPLKYKIVLMLKYYHDFSYEQIAEILNIPRNTVASLIFRGKQELRKRIKK